MPQEEHASNPSNNPEGSDNRILQDVGHWLRHYWDAPREKSKRTDTAVVLLTTAIAIAAFWTAYIFDGQLVEMQKQTVLDERAWVGVVSVETEGGSEANGFFKLSKLNVVLHNRGKTPSLDIKESFIPSSRSFRDPIPDFDKEFMTMEETARRNMTKDQEASFLESFWQRGGVLPPGGSNTVTIATESAYETRRGKEPFTIYFVGKITYHDPIEPNKERGTKFCLVRYQSGTFMLCPVNSDMY